MIHNINEYKKAKIIVKDLEKILKIIQAAETSLHNYTKYRPVQHILTTIIQEKAIVELYLETHKIIVETKGATRK